MDQSRTHDAMDAVASLYLSGPEATVAPPKAEPVAVEADAVQLHIDQALREGRGGAAPALRDPPREPYPGDPLPIGEAGGQSDGPSSSTARAARGESDDGGAGDGLVAPVLEAVLVGNLPGFASPWISQYAHHRARPDMPVVVAHVDAFETDVDLFSTRPMAVVDQGRLERPDAVLGKLPGPIGGWLVHLHEPEAPAIRQLAHRLPVWTFLTGADEAAVVGVYRLIKIMMQGRDEHDPAPRIQLMFMGCDEQRARGAFGRIAQAADTYLETPAEMAGWIQRMQPFHRRKLGTLDHDDGELASTWDQILSTIAHRTTCDASIEADVELDVEPDDAIPILAPTPADPPTADHLPAATVACDLPGSGLDDDDLDMDMDDAVAWLDHLSPDAPESDAADEPIRDAGEPAGELNAELEDDPDDALSGVSIDLAGYLEGTTPLAARCPRQPEVQLAVDGEGRLHLMLTAADLASDAVVSTLVETQAWAAEHRALIALTCPQLAVDADPDPTIHVFTDEPKSYARLAYGAQMAGPPIRLHLLRTVALGAERMWVHEALN
ncbi:MAG: hypothetical protein CMJ49_00880 [Planctomycetaceae bacterium]|nr:hypothetical protein [Planctomycetaceae bacterium]